MPESESHTDAHNATDEIIDLEWEEWDGKSPFLHHCIAGSIAGVAEHTLLYPVDTIKTHMQAYCSACPDNKICSVGNGKINNLSSTLPKRTAVPPPSQAAATATAAPQGMWLTMRNLIQHGHSTTTLLQNAARQTGTLTAPSALTPNIPKQILPSSAGYIRLWRGVQTMAVGCVPAHALYFSTYERIKTAFSRTSVDAATGATHTYLGPIGASIAGAASTVSHDIVMTPMDTIKQRMQLGHYNGMGHAFAQIVRAEGWSGLYRSFGVTLLTNIPYGMVMVSTNEFLRDCLLSWRRQQQPCGSSHSHQLDISTTLVSGCGAGLVAAAVTAPLDRIKTRLQTQRLWEAVPYAAQGCPKAKQALERGIMVRLERPEYVGLRDAFGSIVKEEGVVGLWRGLVPRLLTHSPSVAISWTSYEAAKRWLAISFDG